MQLQMYKKEICHFVIFPFNIVSLQRPVKGQALYLTRNNPYRYIGTINFMEEKLIDEKRQGESLVLEQKEGNQRKLFIESYGCQMNFSDRSEEHTSELQSH